MLEYKSLPQFTKEISGRTVTGIFAVHGNVDEGRDRSWPGSFADTTVKGRSRVRFLWQHDGSAPPIAKIESIREVARNELPEAVLGYAPEATGGVEVARTYFENARAQEVFEAVREKAVDEMSYAYNVKQWDVEEDDEGRQVRNLRRVELYDISDVNWGMNPATAGIKTIQALLEADTPFDQHAAGVESVLSAFVERAERMHGARIKEGRVLSSANRKRIEGLLASLKEVASDLEELLAATAPKADPATVQQLMIEWQRTLAQLNGATV